MAFGVPIASQQSQVIALDDRGRWPPGHRLDRAESRDRDCSNRAMGWLRPVVGACQERVPGNGCAFRTLVKPSGSKKTDGSWPTHSTRPRAA
jgi:hypothetical protein